MPVNSITSLLQFVISGLGQALSFPYYFINSSDLTVYGVNPITGSETLLILGTDYTVTGAGNPGGGTVTLEGTGLHYAIGDTVTVQRNPPTTQPTNYLDGTAFPAAVDNAAIDWLEMQIQAVRDGLQRTLRVPVSNPRGVSAPLALSLRKSRILGFDANGDPTYYGTTVNPQDISNSLVLSTGGVASRTLADRFSDTANVLDFGADHTGITNSTAAVQAAINSGNGKVVFPGGTYVLGQLTVPRGMTIEGQAGYFEGISTATRIIPVTNTTTVFYVNTKELVTFRDFSITGSSPTAGFGIELDNSNAVSDGIGNVGSLIENVTFDNMWGGMLANKASGYALINCRFQNIVTGGSGCFIDNQYNKDQGDGYITGCTFQGNGVGIAWQGGDGLRVINNKFLTGTAINANLTTGINGGQFYVIGNSFDNSTAGVQFFMQMGSTNAFADIIIADNQFFGYSTTSHFIEIMGVSGGRISNVTLSNNAINQYGGAVTDSGITIDYVDRVNISGGHLYSSLGTATGVSIGSNCTGVKLDGSVQILGWSTPYTIGSANSNLGSVTLSSGAATVANTSITANAVITLTLKTVSGTVAAPFVKTITPGTGFTVGGGGSDNSTYNYEIRY